MLLSAKEVQQVFKERESVLGVECTSRLCWTFRLFHPCQEMLKASCAHLIAHHEFHFSWAKWNRDPNYQVQGWMCQVFVIRSFQQSEFRGFLWAMGEWLSDGDPAGLRRYLEQAPPGRLPQMREVNTLGAVVLAGPDPIPKRLPGLANWEARWAKGVSSSLERLKASKPLMATPQLDNFSFRESEEGTLSPWLFFCAFELTGSSIFITSMQMGPTQDGLGVSLSPGSYRVELQFRAHDGAKVNFALRVAARSDSCFRGAELGAVSTDIATVGLYDEKRLRACFHHDPDRLFDWGAAAMDEALPGRQGTEPLAELPATFADLQYGVLVYDHKRALTLPYATSGDGDGTYPVYELLDGPGGRRSGFEIVFERLIRRRSEAESAN